jgi:predicted TIM-barrel fold metal-dependent hydrolase
MSGCSGKWRTHRSPGQSDPTTPEYFFKAAAESTDADGSKTITRMDEAGVDISCTMPMDQGYRVGDVGVASIEEINRRSCEIAANSGGRIISFCGVDPRRPGATALLRKAIDEWGAKGL